MDDPENQPEDIRRLTEQVRQLLSELTHMRTLQRRMLNVHPDEFALVAPYVVNPDPDKRSAKHLLFAMYSHDREIAWCRAYFFQPLDTINHETPPGTAYSLFHRLARELEAETAHDLGLPHKTKPYFTLAQVEAVVNELAQRPQRYAVPLGRLRMRRAQLIQLRNDLSMTDAFSAYAREIRQHLHSYTSLDAAGREVLEKRLLHANDSSVEFDACLQKGMIADPDGKYHQAHELIKQLESLQGPRHVNLRWFADLPGDLASFVNVYR